MINWLHNLASVHRQRLKFFPATRLAAGEQGGGGGTAQVFATLNLHAHVQFTAAARRNTTLTFTFNTALERQHIRPRDCNTGCSFNSTTTSLRIYERARDP